MMMAMDNTDRILNMAQDMASIQAWMLTISHALETGEMPPHFIVFNDDYLYNCSRQIEDGIFKIGVKPPKEDL